MRSGAPQALVGGALLCFAAAVGAQTPQPEPNATMGEIVEVLGFVLPLGLQPERFADPARRDEILAALRRLARDGERLEAHAGSRDAGFGFLSRSLASDSRLVVERYEAGRYDEASFLLYQITDHCVACHTRLPDARAHPVGQRLVETPEVQALPLEERVKLQAATRQFDEALAGYEELFAAEERSPADLDLLGHPDAYLELCLRVREDPQRPLATFERLAARPDVTPPLAETLAVWIASLQELSKRTPLAAPLPEARALLSLARDRQRFPDDRRALVYYVAASGVLNRYVGEGQPSRRDLAEAYYLLGLIESRVGRAFWPSQTEDYLEAAIRTAPAEPFAAEAYGLLEEFVASGYQGADGGTVPADVRERLAELLVLILAAQPNAEPAP